MRQLLALLVVSLVFGCIGGQEVKVVDVDRATVQTTVPLQAEPTTSTLPPPTTSLEATTTTLPSSTTTLNAPMNATSTTASTASTTSTSATTTSTASTTTSISSTSTTIQCTEVCTDIRYPNPRNCRVGCCISQDTHCQYVAGGMTGEDMRCRCR